MCLRTITSVRTRCQDIPVVEGSRSHPLVRPRHCLARIFWATLPAQLLAVRVALPFCGALSEVRWIIVVKDVLQPVLEPGTSTAAIFGDTRESAGVSMCSKQLRRPGGSEQDAVCSGDAWLRHR